MQQTLTKVKNLEKFIQKHGDDMDFVEWSSLYQMRNGLLEKKTALKGKM